MTAATCAICSRPVDPKFSPFCSKRCADVDLSRWLKGSYEIPGEPLSEEGMAEAAQHGENPAAPGNFRED